jgi:hypothetical protein
VNRYLDAPRLARTEGRSDDGPNTCNSFVFMRDARPWVGIETADERATQASISGLLECSVMASR